MKGLVLFYLFVRTSLFREQLDFRENITSRMQTFEKNFHSQHIHFQDMSKGDFSMAENVFEEPVYINVIREPIARFISHFYYRRFNSGHKVLFNSSSPLTRINVFLNQCLNCFIGNYEWNIRREAS